ncbi:hypothetical protein LMG1864_03565 [Achromobacter ruhlandii]|nr:hypothetical protein LMG1864_03565 [Achromobacter ruhlandii]
MIMLRFIALFWNGGLKQRWGKVCEAARLSLIHKQRIVDVNRHWNEVAKLERQGLMQDDRPLQDAVNDAFMAQNSAQAIETEKLLLRAAMCEAEDIPPKRVGEFYSRMAWDGDPDEPFYLTDSGMLKVRGAIAEAGKRKRERLTFWAVILFGLAGSMSLSVFLWARRFKSCYPRAAVNRSPNRIANWFMATFQSKVALTDLASTLRSASHRSLMVASSVGK